MGTCCSFARQESQFSPHTYGEFARHETGAAASTCNLAANFRVHFRLVDRIPTMRFHICLLIELLAVQGLQFPRVTVPRSRSAVLCASPAEAAKPAEAEVAATAGRDGVVVATNELLMKARGSKNGAESRRLRAEALSMGSTLQPPCIVSRRSTSATVWPRRPPARSRIHLAD